MITMMIVSTNSNGTDQIRECLQKIPKVLGVFPLPIKGNMIIFALLRNLSELSDLKPLIEHASSAEDIRTYIWTGIKHIPENLSFGLPAKTIEAYKKKPQPTIYSKDTKRKINMRYVRIFLFMNLPIDMLNSTAFGGFVKLTIYGLNLQYLGNL